MLIVIVRSTKYRTTVKFLSHTGKIIYIKGQDNTHVLGDSVRYEQNWS